MPALWVYWAVAFGIALLAFGIAQIAPGYGVPFVILTTTAWAGYSARRYRRIHQSR